jgi:hypothetical protein
VDVPGGPGDAPVNERPTFIRSGEPTEEQEAALEAQLEAEAAVSQEEAEAIATGQVYEIDD